MVTYKRLRCVLDPKLPRPQALTKLAEPLRSDCGVETFSTSKRRPTPGCHHRSCPTRLGLDVGREPD